jgi:hypothetical protein
MFMFPLFSPSLIELEPTPNRMPVVMVVVIRFGEFNEAARVLC